MKTKGALIWEFNQPWSIEEIEIGDPVKDEVKIQMEASGMSLRPPPGDRRHPDGRLPGVGRA
jgi:hypothetical protein